MCIGNFWCNSSLSNLFHRIIQLTLPMPISGLILLGVSVGSILFALTLQFGFDIDPCVLCLWQRVPFAMAALLALTACLWAPYGPHTRIILILCAMIFLGGGFLAIFHTGIEQHWWLGTSGCAVPSLQENADEDFIKQIFSTVASCDQIDWTLFGLSLANWNIPFSLGLAGFSLAAAMGRKVVGRRGG